MGKKKQGKIPASCRRIEDSQPNTAAQMCAGESSQGHRFNRVKPPQREKPPSPWLRAASGAHGVCTYAKTLYQQAEKESKLFHRDASGLYLQQNVSNDGVHVKQGIGGELSDQRVTSGEGRKSITKETRKD